MIENFTFKTKYSVNDLLEIIALLRSENGCPWDREQTHTSIKKNFIEECYEVVEAINLKDKDLLREELGDVLFVIGNLANRCGIDSARALEYSIQEFERRMIYCEEHYAGDDLAKAPKEEMIKLWKEAKKYK